ncbi:MAG: GlcNAc-PI de-N-acetylase [Ancylobacter novellus]|uniref:GlcNAc-PI de-N-acetylase n=1 Tax=Ancylobacter novellus TaxID=921 RepID=A0A2W5K1V9_ANCNO|nr:MAG: GlcNAc-PI de-N-acetylase [Ancylobacter novellus]
MVSRPRFATPLRRSAWAQARWLVLAPHADDEIIGAGALIRETAVAGRLAGVVFVTDGRGSHGADGPSDLAAIRRWEARAALRRLAPSAPAPLFLDWPDAHPPSSRDHVWRRASRRLQALCRRYGVDAIAATSPLDPHCDHQAVAMLAREVARTALRRVEVFDYVVWADRRPGGPALRTAPAPQGLRRLALAAHRSQMTPLYGEGFRVPDRLRRMPAADLLYPAGPRHAA